MAGHRPRFSDAELEILEHLLKEQLKREDESLRYKQAKDLPYIDMVESKIAKLNKLLRKVKRNQTKNRRPVSRKSYQELVDEARALVPASRRS